MTTVKTGAALINNIIDQADWNGRSSLVSSIDPTKYNLYKIEYAWFGVSNILFKVYNGDTGKFEVVHTLTFANGDDLSISYPNLYIQSGVASLGSASVLTLETTGQFGGTMGLIDFEKQPKSSAISEKTISTETVMLVISNRKQINGYSNQSELILSEVSIATDGTKAVVIKIILNPTTLSADTTSDYTDYKTISSDDLLIYDTKAATYTGGSVLKTNVITKGGGIVIDFTGKDITLSKDDVLIITASSATSNTVNVSTSFISDI